MPKVNINDVATDGSRIEVSWRNAEYRCPCGTAWMPVAPGTPTYCPECNEGGTVAIGETQLATNTADPVTLDPAAIERTVDALMRAGSRAFPGWKLPVLDKSEDMTHWMWGFICSAEQLIREYRETADCGSPDLADEWRAAFVQRLRPGYHEHLAATPSGDPATP